MNYHPDANELAAREERRLREQERAATSTGTPQKVRGTLTIWQRGRLELPHDYQSLHVFLDLKHPGQIIAYDTNMDAEVYMLRPGAYACFVPDREGE